MKTMLWLNGRRSPRSLNWIITVITLLVFSAQFTQVILAQQPVVNVPTAQSSAQLLASVTTTTPTTGTATTRPAPQGDSSITVPTQISGAASIYGWRISLAAGCYLQIFDRGPNVNNVTPGTTPPLTSWASTPSTGDIYVSDVALTGITSMLQVFASTAPSGGTICTSPAVVQFFYKKTT